MILSTRRTTVATLATVAALSAAAVAGCGGSQPHRQQSAASDSTPGIGASAVGSAERRAQATSAGGRHRAQHRSVLAAAQSAQPVVPHVHIKPATGHFSAVATGSGVALTDLAESVLSAGGSTRSSSTTQSTTSAGASEGSFHYSSTSGTAERFIEGADQICTTYRAAVQRTGQTSTTLVSQENELQTLTNQTAAALNSFSNLAPPSKEAALAEQYASLTQTSVADFVKAQTRSTSTSESAGVADENQDMQLANTSGEDALSAQSIAHKLGFKVCGTSGAEWL